TGATCSVESNIHGRDTRTMRCGHGAVCQRSNLNVTGNREVQCVSSLADTDGESTRRSNDSCSTCLNELACEVLRPGSPLTFVEPMYRVQCRWLPCPRDHTLHRGTIPMVILSTCYQSSGSSCRAVKFGQEPVKALLIVNVDILSLLD